MLNVARNLSIDAVRSRSYQNNRKLNQDLNESSYAAKSRYGHTARP